MNWSPDTGENCRWPRCRKDGEVHFLEGSNALTEKHGLWLCDEHAETVLGLIHEGT